VCIQITGYKNGKRALKQEPEAAKRKFSRERSRGVSAMSTPIVNPIDPFAHVSHETHERAYAPAKARERAGAEGDPGENDPLWSPYAPKKARTQSAQAPHVAITESVAPLLPPRGPESLREHSERHALDGELDISLQPAHPHSQQPEHPAAARRDDSIRDLKRLEITLRRIQREEAAARIPRAAQLPPVPGLVTPDASDRRRGREMLDFPSPRSLEPERMPPPPTGSRRHKLGALLVILVASILAAPIGYYFLAGDWSPSSQPAPEPQMASLGAKTDAPPSSIGQQELRRTMAGDNDRGILAQSEISSQPPETAQPRKSSEGETVAMVQPRATGAQTSPSSKATRVLDPEEIKLLMKQGQQFIAAGDVVTARTVLQRAAEAGNASAAIALGATYDPKVLAKLGVVGVSADVEKARSWYQRAETLGSPDARGRLEALADR
jgi:hypothetical protein